MDIRGERVSDMQNLVATLNVDDTIVSYKGMVDSAQMATTIQAELNSQMARLVAHKVEEHLAHRCNMDPRGFLDFLQFLSEDAEIQARFTAWRAKRRITG